MDLVLPPVHFPPRLVRPTDGSSHESGANMPLSAAFREDVAVQSVGFYLDGALVATAVSPPWDSAIASPSVGTHTVQARATYTDDSQQTTDAVIVTVELVGWDLGAAIPGPVAYWVAEDWTQGTVPSWGDDSGNKHTLRNNSAAANVPTSNATAIDSKRAVEFDGNRRLVSIDAASTWKFLRDGTGSSFAFRFRCTATTGTHTIVDNNNQADFFVAYDAANERLIWKVNGTAINYSGTAGSVPRGTHTVLMTLSSSGWAVYMDDITAIASGVPGTLDTTNPAFTLNLGSQVNFSNLLIGYIRVMAIWPRVISSNERAALFTGTNFSDTIGRTNTNVVWCIGNSNTALAAWLKHFWNNHVDYTTKKLDMVGTVRPGTGSTFVPDLEHNGVSGERILTWQPVAAGIVATLMGDGSARPTHIVIDLGLNDCNPDLGAFDVNAVIAAYRQIIDAVRVWAPSAQIMLGLVTPENSVKDYETQMNILNPAITALATEKSATAVDLFTALTPAATYVQPADIHWNDLGAQQVAKKFGQAMGIPVP